MNADPAALDTRDTQEWLFIVIINIQMFLPWLSNGLNVSTLKKRGFDTMILASQAPPVNKWSYRHVHETALESLQQTAAQTPKPLIIGKYLNPN